MGVFFFPLWTSRHFGKISCYWYGVTNEETVLGNLQSHTSSLGGMGFTRKGKEGGVTLKKECTLLEYLYPMFSWLMARGTHLA